MKCRELRQVCKGVIARHEEKSPRGVSSSNEALAARDIPRRYRTEGITFEVVGLEVKINRKHGNKSKWQQRIKCDGKNPQQRIRKTNESGVTPVTPGANKGNEMGCPMGWLDIEIGRRLKNYQVSKATSKERKRSCSLRLH